jgi:acetyl esterase
MAAIDSCSIRLASRATSHKHRRHMKHVFAILVAAGLAASVRAEPAKVNIKGAKVEFYKVASGDELKLYILNPKGHKPKTDQRPAIVFFFGGGWNGGTPTQFEQHSRYLAARGMVAAVADYRVKSRQGTDPRACVADGKSAVRYLRTHARRLGIDPKRIAAGGGSAGGHVAATTGFIDGYDDEKENLKISSKANALALYNPVYDNGPKGYGHDRVKEYWKGFSPAQNITKDDPPAVVFLGSKDSLIPVSTAEKFKADMEKVGLKSHLHIYEGQPHGFFNERKGGTEIFFDTIRKTDKFLVEVGYLKGGVDEMAMKAVSQPPVAKKAKGAKKSKNTKKK